jgi:hypothetical protein
VRVCVVTVHGIGFQQAPAEGVPGYADELHRSLRVELGAELGDDPYRAGGPVYVRSEVGNSSSRGLGRLDNDKPLSSGGPIAHVALVYSPSEPLVPRAGSAADTIARAVLSHSRYASILRATRILLGDALAAIREHEPVARTSSLRPRNDPPLDHPPRSHLRRLLRHDGAPPGRRSVLSALEDDIATYVARNDLRERVRGFVEAALLAIAARDDVDAIVVNAHSQGTVLCWDVLCRLPLFAWREDPERQAKLRAFVTAGSPIRKYVDLFAWGDLVGQMAALEEGEFGWHNFWDRHDPVADPLNPPVEWRPGTRPTAPSEDGGLLRARDPDSGDARHVTVSDVEVNNVKDSAGGGLQAHDYWNNKKQFIPGLAEVLRAVGR